MKNSKSLKDINGGLSKEGLKFYNDQGHNLKKGVTEFKTVEDLKRWGMWARRFYAQKNLPALVKDGEPTRLALTANAWGIIPPTTVKEAREIAKLGLMALEIYHDYISLGYKPSDKI